MGDETVTINGKTYPILWRRARSRYSRARVSKGQIIISTPYFLSRYERLKDYNELKKKIIRNIQKRKFEEKSEIVFQEGNVEVMGKRFTITVREGQVNYSRAKMSKDGRITITIGQGLGNGKRAEHISLLSRRLIAKRMLPEVESRLNELNSLHFNSDINAVRLKDITSLWGSCSRRNNISLDFRLLFAPSDVMDSVIIHELAHTKHRNHSKRFWDLVYSVMSDYKTKRKWLNANASLLKPMASDTSALNNPTENMINGVNDHGKTEI